MKHVLIFLSVMMLCLTFLILALIFNDPAATVKKFQEQSKNKEEKTNSPSSLFPSAIDINVNVNLKLDRNTVEALRHLSALVPQRPPTGGGATSSGDSGAVTLLPDPEENVEGESKGNDRFPYEKDRHRHPNPQIFEPIDPQASKTLIIAITQEPDSLDPIFQEMSASKELYGFMFRQLTTIDPEGVIFPELAEKLPSLENGLWEILEGGRMRTTFPLREAYWSDGHPLTAEDFVFTYEVVMDEMQPVIVRDVYNRIERMESKDSGRTLVIHWKSPYAYVLESDIWAIPKHHLEPLYRADRVNYHIHEKVAKHPLGNGPFRLKEWASGSHLTLEINPFWYGQKPHFEKIIYKLIKSDKLLEDMIVSGEIQLISTIGLTLDQAIRLEENYGQKVQVIIKPGLVWEHIDCNLDDPILKDRRVRQALMYGMDREALVSLLFKNKQPVSHSWLPEKHYGYNAKVYQYKLDVQKAERKWRAFNALYWDDDGE
jgi:ABC-type transport system substrate-binding protein